MGPFPSGNIIMMKKIFALSCLFVLSALPPAQAGQRDMISSCYGLLKIDTPAPVIQREIFVLVDQTTPVDVALQKALVDSVTAKLVPETAVTIVTFSAFIGDRYANLVFSGVLERPPSQAERDDMPKRKLRDLDTCLAQQAQFAKTKTAEAMVAGFGTPSTDIARSDILASLKDISVNVVGNSPAERRDVLLISDMLENSSITSFYAKNSVKRIDAKAELAKVGDFGDFAGANIYIAGAGTINIQGKKQIETYRDPKTMDALEGFWREYFSRSNATMAAFGKPSLLGKF